MAKTISINTEHVYTSRGETETVAEALAWVNKYMTEETEDGEGERPSYTPADLIVYAVRRLRALHKDGKRAASGKLASRLYAPRLDLVNTEKVKIPAALKAAVESIDAAEAKLNPEPTPKPAKKAAPKASAPKAPRKPRAPKAEAVKPAEGGAAEVAPL